MNRYTLAIVTILTTACTSGSSSFAQDKLALWNEGATKSAIVEFVESITERSNPRYLPPAERVAVFDMDGTILLEKPQYALFDIATRQLLEDIERDPSLKNKQPHKAIYEKDWAHFGDDWYSDTGLYSVLLHAAGGSTAKEYDQEIRDYLKNTKHERFGARPHELVFAPVVQLIDYLKTHGFEVYIVTGSTVQFVRNFASEAVRVPPENVIGTTILTEWGARSGGGVFVLKKEFVEPINDEAGKPVNIRNKIGRIPVIAVGNSNGDYHMLEYSKTAGHSLQLIVNHDDPEREYEYKTAEMKALIKKNDWTEISMKNDFKTVFANLPKPEGR